MYDALLGGSHNFGADRQAAAAAIELVPDLPKVAISNRAFLRRAVRFLVDAGIRQFLDLGAGIPTVGNTHEVAQQAHPGCRVAYVDIDPVAVAHATAILKDDPDAISIQGDLRNPERLLADPRLRGFIDLRRPVGVLLVAVLHLLTDADQPARVVTTLRDAVVPGSYFAISHLTSARRPGDASRLGQLSARRTPSPITFRSQEEITAFFTGLTVVDPGVVELPSWRPESAADVLEEPGGSLGLAGIGRKDPPAS
jgi:hypothetical protein